MGFFDFFKKNDKINIEKAEEEPKNKVLSPLMYKSGWIAVKSDSAEDVIQKLGWKVIEKTDWNTGLEAVSGGNERLFVSDIINGFVIITDAIDIIFSEHLEDTIVRNIAQKFDLVMGFATHRVVEAHYWSKYIDGKCVRKYIYIGESGEIFTEGGITPEEKDLGLKKLVQNEDDFENDDCELPDEDNVMQISEAWGVDPELKGIRDINGFIVKNKNGLL